MSVGLALRYVNLKTIFLTKTALNVFAVKKKAYSHPFRLSYETEKNDT